MFHPIFRQIPTVSRRIAAWTGIYARSWRCISRASAPNSRRRLIGL